MSSPPEPRIDSPRNAAVRRLRQLAGSRRERVAAGLMLLEGVRLVEEALACRVPLVEVFHAPRLTRAERGAQLLESLRGCSVALTAVSDRALDAGSDVASHQGVVALAERPAAGAELPDGPGLLLVAAGLQDPGNLGALVRVAEAAGADGLACVGGVDPWSPRALRAAAGSAFRLPMVTLGGLPELRAALARSGRKLLASARSGGSDVFAADLSGRAALLVGSEGGGLTAELGALADRVLSIPMRGAVESLNVATAAAVILFEAFRQRAVRLGMAP